MNNNFEIKILATGSKGNAYAIIDGEYKLLIDPGITIKKLLKLVNFDLSSFDACLVSHEHKDHSLSALDIVTLGIPCYMSQGTKLKTKVQASILSDFYVEHEIGKWKVIAFTLDHDALEPMGFLIKSPSSKKILYICDTNRIDYDFYGVTHFMVECNYIDELLDNNEDLPLSVKRRIKANHLDFNDVKSFFERIDLTKTEKIYLIHLSDDNSNERLMIDTIQSITGLPVYTK